MPIYVYKNPKTNESIEVIQSMTEDHVYIDEDGLEWKRVFIPSQLNTEASIDPWSNSDFVEKTRDTKGSYGDMIDRSSELSEKRANQNGGVDPVRQKYFKDYSKKRNGAKHPKDNKKKVYENKHVKIDLS